MLSKDISLFSILYALFELLPSLKIRLHTIASLSMGLNILQIKILSNALKSFPIKHLSDISFFLFIISVINIPDLAFGDLINLNFLNISAKSFGENLQLILLGTASFKSSKDKW
jgi:hypothetical protein